MPDEEINLEMLENQFVVPSGVAFAAAREQVLASGQSVLQAEDGHIYEIFADGHRVLVKTIEPPIAVVPGRKITIR